MKTWAFGFDPGLNFGFVGVDSDFLSAWRPRALGRVEIPRVGQIKTGVRVIEGRGTYYGLAAHEIDLWLEVLSSTYKIGWAFSEGVAGNFMSQKAMLAQLACHTKLAEWADRHGIPLVRYAPGQLKLFATGSGHADKKQMFVEAARAGYPVVSEHDADAAWALERGMTVHWGRVHGVPAEKLGVAERVGGKKRRRKPSGTAAKGQGALGV